MSDLIPFEIQVEIIKRLPIKSLIRFRSVSKPWKSLIDSSQFIANYKVPNSQSQRVLVSYRDREDSELRYVWIDDDDTFPQRKCSLNVSLFIRLIKKPEIIGSSHGLLCLYGHYPDGDDSSPNPEFGIVVLWNPCIRKSVVIKVPNEIGFPHKTVVGFGVCPHTNDPKLVKINYSRYSVNWGSRSCIPLQVEVFTLSSRAWRIPSRNLPRKSIFFGSSHIAVDGFIYWIATESTGMDDEREVYNLIITFNLTSEEFREIYVPDYLADPYAHTLSISKLKDSLVVIDSNRTCEKTVYNVWMMEHGVPNSFTKLFTIDAPYRSLIRVLGFRKNGEPMLEMIDMFNHFSATLEVYEPSSKHHKDLGIYGKVQSFLMSSYMETLMLLDQPDCNIYSNL